MAQVIKIKRGGLANLVATTPTLVQGELLLATGSLNGLKSTFFVASASDSPSLPYAKIETITNGATLGASLDSNFEGLLIHSASDNKLYRYSGTQFVELPIAAGSFTGTLPVSSGGTGQSTLTDGAVLIGNGTTAIEQLTLTNGQLLIGNTSNSPSTATLTAGAGMFVTNGAGSITLSVDSGSMLAYYSGSIFSKVSGDIVINSAGVATIQANSVALGTDTTGNYVATISNALNGGLTISNSGTETALVTMSLNFGDLTEATVSVGTDYIPFIDGGATGDSRKESIADLISAVAGTNLTATDGVLSVPSVTNLNAASGSYLVSASVIGTANEVEVIANGFQGIQIGLPNNVTIGGTLTITQDLIVNGTTTTLNTDILNVEDNIISVNYAGLANAYAGLYALDVLGGTTGSFLWDTSNDYWVAGAQGTEKRIIRINTGNTFSSAERFVGTKGADTLDSFAASVDGHYLKYNGTALEVTNIIDGGTF